VATLAAELVRKALATPFSYVFLGNVKCCLLMSGQVIHSNACPGSLWNFLEVTSHSVAEVPPQTRDGLYCRLPVTSLCRQTLHFDRLQRNKLDKYSFQVDGLSVHTIKHNKLVEFLSNLNVKSPCTNVRPSRANIKSPVDFPTTVLHRTTGREAVISVPPPFSPRNRFCSHFTATRVSSSEEADIDFTKPYNPVTQHKHVTGPGE